jgi:hypothetical protein
MPLLDRVFSCTVESTLEAGVVVVVNVVVAVLTGIAFGAFAGVWAGVEPKATLLRSERFYFSVRTRIC